ncbi:MAG: hypothetical protein SXA11_13930 [Cyanobacteriota bacterium]|nr:hypothetical protein [Cyanobacteriota bacterium]
MNIDRRYLLTTILIFSTLLTDLSLALAETKKADFTIDSSTVSSYRSLMQQAEDRAKRAIATEFADNPELTEITITILGERLNRISPLLLIKVTRSQWEEDPEMEKWTRYFVTSEVLLGFRETQEETPTTSPPPPPPPGQRTPANSSPGQPQTIPTPSSPTNTPSPSPAEQRERRLEEDSGFRDD